MLREKINLLCKFMVNWFPYEVKKKQIRTTKHILVKVSKNLKNNREILTFSFYYWLFPLLTFGLGLRRSIDLQMDLHGKRNLLKLRKPNYLWCGELNQRYIEDYFLRERCVSVEMV